MKETGRGHDSGSGFSVPEVLVGITVLGFAAIGIMSFLGTSLHLGKLAAERSVATSLASDRLLELCSKAFQPAADVANYALPEETLDGEAPVFTLTSGYGEIPEHPGYERTLTLRYDTPVAGMMTAVSTVTWRNLSQGEKSHELITYVHPDLERAR